MSSISETVERGHVVDGKMLNDIQPRVERRYGDGTARAVRIPSYGHWKTSFLM